MKKKYSIFTVLLITVLIVPFALFSQEAQIFRQEGIASWYGNEYAGRPTASGEIFNPSQLTAAHPTLPFGTMLTVTNLHNNKSVTVRVNDRGPFVAARVIDVSRAAAEQLDMIVTGTAPVVIVSLERIAVPAPANAPANAPAAAHAAAPAAQPTNANIMPVASYPAVQAEPALSGVYSVSRVALVPDIVIAPNDIYRLQIGSYKIARNAVEAFERLKAAGLDPAYERFIDSENTEYFRVVLSGIRGMEIFSVTEKIAEAGYREALIRREN